MVDGTPSLMTIEFNSALCGRDKDYVVTNAGPIATFRSDNLTWDFKNLSIREIDP